MSVEVTLTGTIPRSEVEDLTVLLEGVSGYNRQVEIIHELLMSDPKGNEVRLRRRKTIESCEIPNGDLGGYLKGCKWSVELVGPRQNAIHDANVRTIHKTTLPQMPGYSSSTHCSLVLFLTHVGNFANRSETLRVGFIVPLPGPIDVSIFQLSISALNSHPVYLHSQQESLSLGMLS
eukprot:TRINITY_DN11734_c0_g1_i2.p1 TRINITY_DN11734_c0_g1~~TRINITY_DN11734_c0_g1_i2.p1  ORF type:complete len:177 (+),score=11.09 TRINITY_DN11734_c0_g1_i2:137-667(+)